MGKWRVATLYNEILPTGRAHDAYLFRMTAALGAKESACLVCGRGSLSKEQLSSHYGTPLTSSFDVHPLLIVRKNNPFNFSWNLPFFSAAQRFLAQERPSVVLLSVPKQARYHLERKIKGVFYVYEAHEEVAPDIVEKVDLVIATTHALASRLKAPRLTVLPLAVQAKSLPKPCRTSPPMAAYVGQLYREQGVELLLEALTLVPSLHLKVIGGRKEEIEALQRIARHHALQRRVHFLGFHPPSRLPSLLEDVHLFVAPFEAKGRMSYVAHTKIFEYAEWGRPIVAPRLPCLLEEFQEEEGLLFFESGKKEALAKALQEALNPKRLEELQRQIDRHHNRFSFATRAEKFLATLK